jgi:hypothetical protein
MSSGFSVFALQEYPLFPPLFPSWFTHHFQMDRTLGSIEIQLKRVSEQVTHQAQEKYKQIADTHKESVS